jgi:hypothetical protein
MKLSDTLLAAAVTGILVGAAACGSSPKPDAATGGTPAVADPAAAVEKHACKNQNTCKGKGGCKVEGKNACKGQNDCKGQGGCKTDS